MQNTFPVTDVNILPYPNNEKWNRGADDDFVDSMVMWSKVVVYNNNLLSVINKN